MSDDKTGNPEIPELGVSVRVVEFQSLKKVEKQFLLLHGCSPVKHFGVILSTNLWRFQSTL